jgi:hypothetical protein
MKINITFLIYSSFLRHSLFFFLLDKENEAFLLPTRETAHGPPCFEPFYSTLEALGYLGYEKVTEGNKNVPSWKWLWFSLLPVSSPQYFISPDYKKVN